MTTETAASASDVVRLADYRTPTFLVDTVSLDIHLDGAATTVAARLALRRNPASGERGPLRLDGDELRLIAASLDGAPLAADAYEAGPGHFVLHAPPDGPFMLELRTGIDPTSNSQLMGIFRSNGVYCSQCEPEGFRRITYFPDRPDVLAVYTTRLEASRTEAPVLLSNGNRIEAGTLPGGRHFAVWHDPFPKPSYLFAVVAGDLGCVRDGFRTGSGREVTLEIHVEHGKEARCTYAMDALKRSMRWDEEMFGCEYDLDIFMIVAVSDFNMGAMENKGLNIFNDKYVLADPETATDQDFANVEAVIAHEYFHNWTGNRITCRDWFQLCLKEGLTVFRDQEFSADARSRAVKRISDVRLLRNQQFAEDAGPLAHAVRPEIYREINNFYTATVYEKGAELIRMLRILVGGGAFRAGMDLYLDRHDGAAVTIEDFLACFAQTSGRDLSVFLRWYSQAGTPTLTARGTLDAGAGTYRLDLAQSVPATPGQPVKAPACLPVALGFIGAGGEVPVSLGGEPFDGTVVLETESASFLFEGVTEPVTPSLLRGFSAPVKLEVDLGEDDLLLLLHRDTDPFNRWQAMQTYAGMLLRRLVHAPGSAVDEAFVGAMGGLVTEEPDPAFAALALALPAEADIARDIGCDIDPDAVLKARQTLRRRLAEALRPRLHGRYHALAGGVWTPDAADAGRRALRNGILDLLCSRPDAEAFALAERQFAVADNMTDRIAALASLVLGHAPQAGATLAAFEARHGADPLALDKWFTLQAIVPAEGTLASVKSLTGHPGFSANNPNRVRALVGSFASGNQTQFNRPDGAGYDFVADWVIDVDGRNAQLGARLVAAFGSWQALETGRRARAMAALRRIEAHAPLSRDVSDIVGRMLGRGLPSSWSES